MSSEELSKLIDNASVSGKAPLILLSAAATDLTNRLKTGRCPSFNEQNDLPSPNGKNDFKRTDLPCV